MTIPVSVDLTLPCIEWTGAKQPNRYGRLSYRGKVWYAHRLIWTLLRGPIPEGLLVCHACDNPPCVQLKHLFLGTQLDNIRDATSKGRMHPGSKHGMAKLTEPDVRLIRSLSAQGLTGRMIAEGFGVNENTVYHILNRRTWTHV